MILVLVGLTVIAAFGAGALWGAPYVPVLGSQIGPILKALDLEPGQALIDLGCGDGKLLKAAAQLGIKGIGYEINPWLVLAAKVNCFKYRELIKISWSNYWQIKLPKSDAVFVFLIEHYMGKLDNFLKSQPEPPRKVLSYIYAIPGRKPTKTGPNYYLYNP